MMSEVISVWLIYVDGIMFFFFKQKTAYEMRISDWSSDVCSSDLEDWTEKRASLFGESHSDEFSSNLFEAAHFVAECSQDSNLKARSCANLKIASQIGRASCRERVCQYV